MGVWIVNVLRAMGPRLGTSAEEEKRGSRGTEGRGGRIGWMQMQQSQMRRKIGGYLTRGFVFGVDNIVARWLLYCLSRLDGLGQTAGCWLWLKREARLFGGWRKVLVHVLVTLHVNQSAYFTCTYHVPAKKQTSPPGNDGYGVLGLVATECLLYALTRLWPASTSQRAQCQVSYLDQEMRRGSCTQVMLYTAYTHVSNQEGPSIAIDRSSHLSQLHTSQPYMSRLDSRLGLSSHLSSTTPIMRQPSMESQPHHQLIVNQSPKTPIIRPLVSPPPPPPPCCLSYR